MIKQNINKVLSTMILIVMIILNLGNVVKAATDITKADIKYVKDCGDHLQAKGDSEWYTIVASYVEYTAPDGKKYPAYCLDNTKPGVGNSSIGDIPEGYSVNIDKFLDNDKVYRAVINGYPYKTPEQLGVVDKYDAFIATKQAIYSVLYNYNVSERYKGVDERGKNIKAAIERIVKIARDGVQKQNSPTIKFEKIGDILEDSINKNYYSQTYNVRSDITMKEYTITGIKDFPSGTVITDINNNKKTTFSEGEKFKVLLPKENSRNIDISGLINIETKCKTFPVFYGKKNNELQPYALSYAEYGNNSASMTMKAKIITGKIKIIKTSEDENLIENKKEGDPIENVKFEIYNEKQKKVDQVVTNKEGIAISKDLEKGKYIIREVESGKWYFLNDKDIFAEIKNANSTVEVKITNKSEKPDVDIEKSGVAVAKPNEEIRYDFKIKNTGNVTLDNFIWTDMLPSNHVKITKLNTGTYNEDLKYNIYYKTNKSEYQLLKKDLSTKVNNEINFSKIKLKKGEVITEFKVDFGTVSVNFKSIKSPYINVTVNENVNNNDIFINKTKLEGSIKGFIVGDEDKVNTKVHKEVIKKKKLPRTGF